jgi:hypothetical protein
MEERRDVLGAVEGDGLGLALSDGRQAVPATMPARIGQEVPDAHHRLRSRALVNLDMVELPMLKTCPVCSTVFNAPNSKQIRCSRACEIAQRRDRPKKIVVSACVICGTEIEYWPSEPRKTCSETCFRGLKAQPRPRAVKHPPRPCETCGTIFSPRGMPRRFCTHRCYAEHLSTITGPAHHGWRGGWQDPRPDLSKGAWHKMRRRLVTEAGNRCTACGEAKKRLVVHHVIEVKDAPELALDESNLRVLCQGCHNKIHNPVLSRWRKARQDVHQKKSVDPASII